MRHASPEVRRVSLADKLHNARSTLADIRREGEAGWSRFNGGKQGTLWYYHELIKVFSTYSKNYLLEELERVVNEIEQLAGAETGA
jgi:(p)ppGpp synthase/HD superfamily hydrolase